MHALVSLQNCQHFLILTLYETKKFRGCRLMPIFLSSLFLSFSFSKVLIHPHSLAIAGDGTPVVTSHRERKNASVTVKKKALPTVIATAIFHGLTATSDGILPMTAGTMAFYIHFSE